MRWQNAPIGVWCDGSNIDEFYYNKENKKSKTTKLGKLSGIPNTDTTLEDFLDKIYTLKNLFINDELAHKTLKKSS